MKPITREEQYLNKLAGEEQSIAEPITREEQYLSRLCGADNIIPQKPETRRETYLAALCGEEVETPEPVTRIEQYMNFAAGKSQSKPEKAITREEMYWDKYQGGAVPEEKTVQGDIIHITDATGDNAVALSVALTPTQDLHGYDHPWPAGGGKNLFDQDAVYKTHKQSDGSFLMTGGDSVAARFYMPQELVGKELTFSAYLKIPSDSILTNVRVMANVGGTPFHGNFVSTSEYTRSVTTFTPVSTNDFAVITYGANGNHLLQAKNIQLEIGSTTTDYVPYSNICPINGFEGVTVHVSETQTGGTTYPVTFTSQGTVYGGTVDVVSGEMSIEYIRKTNPTVWQFDSQNNVAIIKIHSYYLVDSNQPECWSNRYEYKGKTTNLANIPDKSCAIYFSYIAIRDSRFTSAEVAEEMLQGSEFVARITPTITATIDPTAIELNEGENYVWTEEGTTTLTYMARAAQRVMAMNKALQTNLKSIELKKGGDEK